jgi:hypothetical protein
MAIIVSGGISALAPHVFPVATMGRQQCRAPLGMRALLQRVAPACEGGCHA